MAMAETKGYKIFNIINIIFLVLVTIICAIPIIHVFMVSLNEAYSIRKVILWPVDFTPNAFLYLLKDMRFWKSMWVSIERVLLGTLIQMLFTIMIAYPLSKDRRAFPGRQIYAWYFIITMLIGGGLLPTYLTVYYTGIYNSIWALIIPTAVPVWNTILLLNFFRQLPKELEEAAFVDGAGHWTVLWKIFLPISKPALATVTLFCIVAHWNQWFDGFIYLNKPEQHPLQTYLMLKIRSANFAEVDPKALQALKSLSSKNLINAQIFIAMVPIMCVYPFLQKYFIKGIVLGSVKG